MKPRLIIRKEGKFLEAKLDKEMNIIPRVNAKVIEPSSLSHFGSEIYRATRYDTMFGSASMGSPKLRITKNIYRSALEKAEEVSADYVHLEKPITINSNHSVTWITVLSMYVKK